MAKRKKKDTVKVVWYPSPGVLEELNKQVKFTRITPGEVLDLLVCHTSCLMVLEYLNTRLEVKRTVAEEVANDALLIRRGEAEKSPMVLELETKIDYLEYIKKAVEEFKQKLEQYPPEDDIVKMLNDQASAKLETTKGLIHTAKSLQAEQLWNETQYETEGLDFIEN